MNRFELSAAILLACLPLVAHAQKGWYAGLDVGGARSDSKIDEYSFLGATTARSSGSSTSFRLRGGYQFGRFFALEVAYVDFGETESHFDPDDCPNGAPGPCPFDVRTSINGIVGILVGAIPIGDRWHLDARLGYGKFEADAQGLGANTIGGTSENPGFHYGIGGGYRFSDHWEVLLDYSEYNQEDSGRTLGGTFGSYNLGETSVTSLGISYHW